MIFIFVAQYLQYTHHFLHQYILNKQLLFLIQGLTSQTIIFEYIFYHITNVNFLKF